MDNRKFLPAIIIITLALGFGAGFFYSNTQNEAPTFQRLVNQDVGKIEDVDFSLFWMVWADLEEKYVDQSKLDVQKMVYGAIKGMVDSVGDPYTVFFEPETTKKFKEEISGAFGGIGIEIGMKANILTVISPIKDTPAFKAGLRAGDKILKIDGKSTADMNIDEAVGLIRGRAGSKVVLTITDTESATKDVTITRATITVPTVEWEIIERDGKRYAYLQIYQFNQTVDRQFDEAVREILRSDARGLIVDLRNNPGGLLDSAINLAGYFLTEEQLVVSEVFGDGTKNDFTADGNASLQKYPTVIMVNGGSASASEILAGAIHDNLKTKIVGEKTFGKGSVQELINQRDNSSLKVTIAKWFTPAGISISDKGIEPDIKVEIPEEDRPNMEIGNPEKDPQLQKALDLLK
ncbi:MAG: hypothetical protein A3C88_00185 [Candidatus Yanofskybacteria bacterium RIFCSPHIGHO2_02_FULL_50_12]|uniref:PDZ domain-containing protein n=1 Tax=Candidatus Yanofskybacteria bacterium RIFCSPHIGHO2_02_FULL_50_12 TaxID=1802685 RepID=A0A1F8FUQ5_9BACT|nr:MAG: hypothetical protein A3C88_00185 [Candidatus Yanofskybacteria bacterium RIFCSPHIGHO2_02_FULL_50_12]